VNGAAGGEHALLRRGHPKPAIVAFAGTDPVSLVNWISDFDAHP
jgi:hypothetical protein